MPVTEYTPYAVFTQANFNFTTTSYVADVQARGSGNWVYNTMGFNSAIRYLIDFFDVPIDAVVNSATAVISVACTNGTSGTGIDGLSYDAVPGVENTGPIPGPGSFADVDYTYSQPLTAVQLWNSIIGLGVANTDGLTLMEYLAVRADWSPPSSGGVFVWCAGDYPPGCPAPPPRAYRPLRMFDPAEGTPQAISAAYLYKFGKPRPGNRLYSYYRTLTADLIP